MWTLLPTTRSEGFDNWWNRSLGESAKRKRGHPEVAGTLDQKPCTLIYCSIPGMQQMLRI